MKTMIAVLTLSVAPFWAGLASAQAPAAPVAGRAPLGVTVIEMETVVLGWSAKRDLIGKTVVNDKDDKIGKIDDLIISPGKGDAPAASFAIVGVGGFLGMGKHVREDLPQLINALRAAHPAVVFTLAPAVGETTEVIDLLADIALRD